MSQAPAIPSTGQPSKVIWAALLLLCFIAAAAALRRLVALSSATSAGAVPQMAVLDAAFASRRALTLAHIIPALLFVLLLPAWFSRRVRGHVTLHRRITYALFPLGAIVGATAIPLALHPVGGVNESAASLLFDSLFLFSLVRSWLFFLRGNFALHRIWMMRAVIVLLGIATTRPVMGIFFATQPITHLTPQQFFGTAFWIGFTTTYIAGEAYLRTHVYGPLTTAHIERDLHRIP
jgi:hypothetical protein